MTRRLVAVVFVRALEVLQPGRLPSSCRPDASPRPNSPEYETSPGWPEALDCAAPPRTEASSAERPLRLPEPAVAGSIPAGGTTFDAALGAFMLWRLAASLPNRQDCRHPADEARQHGSTRHTCLNIGRMRHVERQRCAPPGRSGGCCSVLTSTTSLDGRVLLLSSIERSWMTQQQRDIRRELAVLRSAEECGHVAPTARHFGISQQCF
jgi:hypothetical protein